MDIQEGRKAFLHAHEECEKERKLLENERVDLLQQSKKLSIWQVVVRNKIDKRIIEIGHEINGLERKHKVWELSSTYKNF